MKIFVTVGTQKFPFDRLLRMADDLGRELSDEDSVFAQSGYSKYSCTSIRQEAFLDKEVYDEMIGTCDILITHGGVSSIIKGLKNGKKVIVVPRLKAYKEHVDNHQCEIARSFAEQKYVLLYEEKGASLAELIRQAEKYHFRDYFSRKNRINTVIGKYLKQIDTEVERR